MIQIVLLSAIEAAFAKTITVGVGKDHPTVGEAVEAADEGDTIEIHAGLGPEGGAYREWVRLTGEELTFVGVGGRPVLEASGVAATEGFFGISDSDVTIDYVVLDGLDTARTLRIVEDSRVVVRDSELRNARTTFGGGAVYVAGGSSLRLESSALSGCQGDLGGALRVDDDSELHVEGTTFSGNRSNRDGGAIHCGGGSRCTLVDVAVRDNEAAGSSGGLDCSSADCTVERSEFTDNRALDGQGAAIRIGFESTLRVSESWFCRNEADVGGALWLRGEATVEHSVFLLNRASDAGAIYLSDNQAALLRNDLIGNLADRGPALRAEGGLDLTLHRNVLFAHGSPAPTLSFGAAPEIDLAANLFHANADDGVEGPPLTGDPAFAALDYEACRGNDLRRLPGSAALDRLPDELDPDGSPGDIGAFGPVPPEPEDCVPVAEIVADGIDQDCDGTELCYADEDGDGRGESGTVVSEDLDCNDPGEAPAADDRCPDGPDDDDLDRDGIPDRCDPSLPGTPRGVVGVVSAGCQQGPPAAPWLLPLLLFARAMRRRR